MGCLTVRPIPLFRLPTDFDHQDCLFELKHDGFRALAIIEGHRCGLVSRWRQVYKQSPQLAEALAHSVRAHDAVLVGEIVCCMGARNSLFRRAWPHFVAFDASSIEGEDLCGAPLEERKRRRSKRSCRA